MKPDIDITPQCSICEIGRPAPDGQTMLCPKKGVVSCDYLCRHFIYDPLKRQPQLPNIEEHQKEEFSL